MNAGYGRCRPARPLGPIPASIAIVLGWWLVAHSSGQGWVQNLGDLVAAAVAVGIVGPWLVLRRVRVSVVGSPSDGTAGVPLELIVHTTAPVRLTPTGPAGRSRTAGPLVLVPEGRALLHSVTVEVATAAPFGLQWWTRRVELSLPDPLHVAPRRGHADRVDGRSPEAGRPVDGAGGRAGADGDLRAPRPYRPGDAVRLVHWPASAHTAELMVRELEPPLGPPAEMVVVLAPDPVQAEQDAERAYGTVLGLLDGGTSVLLTTREASGPVTALVQDRREAGRRLAAAVSEESWPVS